MKADSATHPHIEHRETAAGRQAYVRGTRLAVWHVVSVARAYGGDVDATASHLARPVVMVQAALAYAAKFHAEIEAAIADNQSYDFEKLSGVLPGIGRFVVHTPEDEPTTGRGAE